MPDTTTIIVDGVTLTLRKPTEAEAIAYADKQTAFSNPNVPAPSDYRDDGTEELISLVVSPLRAEVESLIEFAPLASEEMGRAVKRLSGDLLMSEIVDSPALVTDDIAKASPSDRLVGVLIGKVPGEGEPDQRFSLVLRKIRRIEWNMLRRKWVGKRMPISEFADMAKSHVVSGAAPDLWDRLPFLSQDIGGYLYKLAGGGAEAATGK